MIQCMTIMNLVLIIIFIQQIAARSQVSNTTVVDHFVQLLVMAYKAFVLQFVCQVAIVPTENFGTKLPIVVLRKISAKKEGQNRSHAMNEILFHIANHKSVICSSQNQIVS